MLAIAVVRHLLGRRSEAGFLAEIARDWRHLFPVLPHQSEASRLNEREIVIGLLDTGPGPA